MTEFYSPHTQKMLDLHQFQGNTNHCGPYCAAMVINSIKGLRKDGSEIAIELNTPFHKGWFRIPRRIENWATFPWGLLDLFKNYEITSKFHLFSNLGTIVTCLQTKTIPIVIYGSYSPMWAHYSIITAFSNQKGIGLIDPAVFQKEIKWIPLQLFLTMWKNYGKIILEINPSET